MMNDEARAARQLAAITDSLLGLFADYCQRASSPDLAGLIQEYKAHRLNLVLTVHASMSGTDFICCAMPVDGAPSTGIAQQIKSEERRVGKECRSRWSPYH